MVVRLAVAGTGSYLPERIVSNREFHGREACRYRLGPNGREIAERLVLDENRIFELSGIRERRYASIGETSSSMGLAASRIALQKAGIKPEDLTGIIFASVTEKKNFPGGYATIASHLGARPKVGYDTNAACAGFAVGLMQAHSFASDYPGNYLVIGSEHMTSMTDQSDINAFLFGDGAGAVVLTPSEGRRGIIACHSQCEPLDGKVNYILRSNEGFVTMPDGQVVLKEAINSMVKSCREVKSSAGWEKADLYIPHQANLRILQGVEKKMEDKDSKIYKNIEFYGNMSSATCAVALDRALSERVIRNSTPDSEGTKVVLTSFGSGLVTASVAIQF